MQEWCHLSQRKKPSHSVVSRILHPISWNFSKFLIFQYREREGGEKYCFNLIALSSIHSVYTMDRTTKNKRTERERQKKTIVPTDGRLINRILFNSSCSATKTNKHTSSHIIVYLSKISFFFDSFLITRLFFLHNKFACDTYIIHNK